MFSIGAIIFMWFLYPKQYDYKAQLSKSMFFYEANMVRRCVRSAVGHRSAALSSVAESGGNVLISIRRQVLEVGSLCCGCPTLNLGGFTPTQRSW